MENNKDKTLESTTDTKTVPQKEFSPKELRRIVKTFVRAWLSGAIEIDFVTAREIALTDNPYGYGIVRKEHLNKELQGKQPFIDDIATFLGSRTASEEERLKATNDLFEWIVSLRSAKRIKGKFMESPDVENRLARLERDMYKLERLFEELKTLLKGAGILR